MRTLLLPVVLASLAGSAAAEPTPARTACAVTFVHAPDDVRLAIERWVGGEARCVGTLELRVLETDGGYYLLAQRPDGRIHERLVPDIDSAGVLVASWVADDWRSPSEPPRAERPFRASPTAMPVAEQDPAPRPVPSVGRWLALGPVFADGESTLGLRAELDVFTHRAISLGIAGAFAGSGTASYSGQVVDAFSIVDYKLVATAGYTIAAGPLALRAAVGAGALHTRGRVFQIMQPLQAYDVNEQVTSFAAEGSLVTSLRLGTSWAVAGGAIATWKDHQQFGPVSRNGVDLTFLAALKRRM